MNTNKLIEAKRRCYMNQCSEAAKRKGLCDSHYNERYNGTVCYQCRNQYGFKITVD